MRQAIFMKMIRDKVSGTKITQQDLSLLIDRFQGPQFLMSALRASQMGVQHETKDSNKVHTVPKLFSATKLSGEIRTQKEYI